YILYFRLIASLGPARAISVTFLIPVFGVLWGRLFLREPVTPRILLGMAIILTGTASLSGVISTNPEPHDRSTLPPTLHKILVQLTSASTKSSNSARNLLPPCVTPLANPG